MFEALTLENDAKFSSKDEQVVNLQKRIDTLVLKIVRIEFLFLGMSVIFGCLF